MFRRRIPWADVARIRVRSVGWSWRWKNTGSFWIVRRGRRLRVRVTVVPFQTDGARLEARRIACIVGQWPQHVGAEPIPVVTDDGHRVG